MRASDEWQKESVEPPVARSRPGSRRNSLAGTPAPAPALRTPLSNHSTPKKSALKPDKCEFLVSGKQILKRSDRANSLPSRRPSLESLKGRRPVHSAKPHVAVSHVARSRDTSLEEDLSLDLSQLSEFEEVGSRQGCKKRFQPGGSSTPKGAARGPRQARSGSVQVPGARGALVTRGAPGVPLVRDHSFDSSKYSSLSGKTSSSNSNFRRDCSTELDYSSVSPGESAASSRDGSQSQSPRSRDVSPQPSDALSPTSQQRSASSCYISWVESERTARDGAATVADGAATAPQREHDGEWSSFWANYNNSVSRAPLMKTYYDQCPTPYRSEPLDMTDFGVSAEGGRSVSPEGRALHSVIRSEGLRLTARETQHVIRCAHVLGGVLARALDRNACDHTAAATAAAAASATTTATAPPEPELELRKKTLTLNLKEPSQPLPPTQRTTETATTQTDISLPNTRSAPRIFEKILRQLSKSSVEESVPESAAPRRPPTGADLDNKLE